MRQLPLFLLASVTLAGASTSPSRSQEIAGQPETERRPNNASRPDNFKTENLIAWCIVPFDAKHRGPAERAEMVRQLGLRRVAYDWRPEHVADFEEEILQYKKHGLEYFAFWNWHDAIEPLIVKHGIKPQVWKTCPSPNRDSQAAKVEAAAAELNAIATKTQELGLKLGLYNHGGWGGEPKNLVAVCQYMRQQHHSDHIGIVYNFHHAHEQIEDFADALKLMSPYLLCLNLNGMAAPDTVDESTHVNKILPLATGRFESQMIQIMIDNGYRGPVGILGHRKDIDARSALQQNLDGLTKLLEQ